MIILLSPAKTLDFETEPSINVCTQPDFLDLSQDLINGLSNLSINEIRSLMGLSEKLAQLNHDRFQSWSKKHSEQNAKQALLAFKGDVYEGLKAHEFSKKDFQFAQKNLRILSGLYGLLKPLDLIQPYRLEMGTIYANPLGKDLYSFWGNRLCETIAKELRSAKSKTVINLASIEYSKAAKLDNLNADIISPVFKDEKKGDFKIISFYAKKARGLMANYLISNEIENTAQLREFNLDGYAYSPEQSTPARPVFLRTEKAKLAA